MGLFALLDDDEPGTSIPIPKLPEISRADRMNMEKETTGLYLSGHPMDDYRKYLKKTHVVPIGALMEEDNSYRDEQIVSVAGIVQEVKMKATRTGSMMAYVTLEDDTEQVEMLAFSNVLNQFGGYLRENSPVVITGKLSLRDDKPPQIIVNRARPMSDFSEQGGAEQDIAPEPSRQPRQLPGQTLYLKLTGEDDPRYRKVRAIVNMFPGEGLVKVFFADTRHIRGARAAFDSRMVDELRSVLGTENVVLK